MQKFFFARLGLIAAFLAIGLLWEFGLGLSAIAVPFTPKTPQTVFTVLLVPLDSRPPCTDYVRDLAAMAGFRVILPPPEMLDDYRRPGNTAAIREWARENINQADAAILSMDMLVHGSLLASREGLGGEYDRNAALHLLRQLRELKPSVKLHAFHIIPRLFIADNPATEKFKQPMAQWSALQDTVSLFENPADIAKLNELERRIPREIRERYQALYAENSRMNRQLLQYAEAGILASLVIGQDDSAPFGLGNIERRRSELAAAKNPFLQQRVFITRGTDEVALTLLGQVAAGLGGETYKAYIHYTEARMADTIMPYMPGTMAKTMAEKLALTGVKQTGNVDDADFILVVHAGDTSSTEKIRRQQADIVKAWIAEGKQVAIIDLAKDFRAAQTLLPFLRTNETPVYRLLAYAGWNTASNSTGTALTQAALVLRGRMSTEKNDALSRDLTRVGFIAARLLDDWYYQKVYRPVLNSQLTGQKIDPYSLQSARAPVTGKIAHQLEGAYQDMIRFEWRNALLFPSGPHGAKFAFARWNLHVGLPWDRTFEIRIDSQPSPAAIILRQ